MRYYILIFAFLFIANLSAQTDSTDILFDEIVVRSNRIQHQLKDESKNVEIISSQEILSSPSNNLFDLLRNVSGIDIRERGVHGVQADVSFRGSTFEQVLILIDGIRMADPQTGHHSAYIPVDLSDIDHIEIIKGSSARSFGQNAFAAAINIVTKKVKHNAIRIGLATGDYALWNLKANVNLVTKTSSHQTTLSRNTSEGYRYNTDYSINQLFHKSRLRLGEFDLEATLGISSRKFGANGFYASPDFTDQYEEVDTRIISVSAGKSFKNGFIKTRAYWRNNQDEYVFIRENPSFFQNNHQSDVYGVDLNGSFETSLGISGLGIDVYKTKLSSNNLGQQERTSFQFFAEHEFSLLKNSLKLVPGLTWSYYSDFPSKVFPGMDLSYSISSDFSFLASFGWTYRVPSFTDLHYNGPQNIGNENLIPEEAFAYEFGLKYINADFISNLSWFHRSSSNLIDWAKLTANQEEWQPLNFNHINFSGIDFNNRIKFKLPAGKLGIKQVNLAYTMTQSELQQNEVFLSNYALQYAKHSITLSTDIQWIKNIYQNIRLNVKDREILDDYTLLDSQIYYQSKQFRFGLTVNNLLGEEFRETNLVLMPGRWFKINIEYNLNLLN